MTPDAGADNMTEVDMSALLLAADRGHLGAVELLLDAGAKWCQVACGAWFFCSRNPGWQGFPRLTWSKNVKEIPNVCFFHLFLRILSTMVRLSNPDSHSEMCHWKTIEI